jgi:ribonuclease J
MTFMKLIVHRGTHQIGGGCTEIRTDRARIVIDIGSELPSADKRGLPLNIEGVTRGMPDCDAIFVTHYHGDHIGEYAGVLSGVPIYIGGIAKDIFAVLQRALERNKEIFADARRTHEKAGGELRIAIECLWKLTERKLFC